MSFEDDLRRIDEHVAKARRLVQRQKGLIIRLRAEDISTWDAERVLWLLETNLQRLENIGTVLEQMSVVRNVVLVHNWVLVFLVTPQVRTTSRNPTAERRRDHAKS